VRCSPVLASSTARESGADQLDSLRERRRDVRRGLGKPETFDFLGSTHICARSRKGRWLAQVLRGHMAYYAVPGNRDAVSAFRHQITLHGARRCGDEASEGGSAGTGWAGTRPGGYRKSV
jgi:hypothetical protein